MDTFWLGLLLVALGAAMQGTFALPQKFIRGWAWEKQWLLYSISGMIVVPWLVVASAIPRPAEVYAGAGGAALARTAVFGAGWGIGSVLFGLGIARVGMALGFAIIISLTAAVGSIVPLAVLHPDQLVTARGALLLLGLAAAIAGVALCSKAGALREAGRAATVPRGHFSRGLAICIASGVTSPMMNFSFVFGTPISEQAVRHGAGAVTASFAIFAVAVTAGFVINAGYCLYLLRRNSTWRVGPPSYRLRNTLYAFLMGVLWSGGFFFYGFGGTWMGAYGAILGWPIFMTGMVLVANLAGIATGEWSNAGRDAIRRLSLGIVLLVIALAVIAAGAQA